jgi:hypothetical protein
MEKLRAVGVELSHYGEISMGFFYRYEMSLDLLDFLQM